jgi:hypothetical protein
MLLVASPAWADDENEDEDRASAPIEARGEFTLGTRFYVIESPYDNDFLGGFWDQYSQTRKKNNNPPFYFNLLHTDVGLFREDETWLVRFESFSPTAANDRVEIDGDYEGLRFDIDFRNYRSEELRYFPEGTFQDQNLPGPFPFGTQYSPDAREAEIRNQNRRLWIQRTGIDGELRFRPEGFGFDLPVLAEVSLRSGFEERKGWRQDSFLLANNTVEPAPLNQRFRGHRRRVRQEVSGIGGGVVLAPGGDWVTDFDFHFENFREKAKTVTFSRIASSSGGAIPPPTSPAAERAFNFVPNTDRISGSMRVAGRVGPASVQAGAFVTHLRQTDKAPLQRLLGLDKQDFTTWSAHGGFDLPLGDEADLAAVVKFSERRNGLDENDFQTGFQLGPVLRRRSELEANVELSHRPAPGATIATGYRYDRVDRNIRYVSPPLIVPELSLIENDNEKHSIYLRGRARLMRRMQLSGEVGWEYAPQRAFPRDLTHVVYLDAKGSYTLPEPVPLTLSVYGGVRDGHGNGLVLTGESTQARKDLDRLRWNYGATATAMPRAGTSLSVTFIQSRDQQDLPYQRTDFPRNFGTSFVNFLPDPDRVHYKSDVKSLSVGGTHALTDSVDARAFTNVNWVRAWFSDSSNTSTQLENVNELSSNIWSIGGGLGWDAMAGLRLDCGYRFDQYLDRRDDEPIRQDDERHTVTLAVTIDIGAFSGAVRSSRSKSN